jgi:hypothetical protein
VRFSIVSHRTIEVFSIVRGRIVWEDLAASCESCGCEIHSGRRNAESNESLAARHGGKRARVIKGVMACVECGKEYRVEKVS